jgi:hypothetical protein
MGCVVNACCQRASHVLVNEIKDFLWCHVLFLHVSTPGLSVCEPAAGEQYEAVVGLVILVTVNRRVAGPWCLLLPGILLRFKLLDLPDHAVNTTLFCL